MTTTRPLALLAAAVVAILAVGATATLLWSAVENPLLVVGLAVAGVVGLACVAGARFAGVTRTPYW